MRPEKQLLLEEIKTQIEENDAFVIFNYLGLSANALSEFRDEIAKMDGSIEMVRKRIFHKAAMDSGLALNKEELPGHVGLLLGGGDPVALVKTLLQLGKDTGSVNVLGGRFEGRMCSSAEVEEISKLPGKQELRAQFLSVLEAPMAQVAAVMNAILSSVVYCLDQKINAEGGES